MSKFFCSECGSAHEYTVKKPNFCQDCGYRFSNNTSTATVASKRSIPINDPEEVSEVPQITQFPVEISIGNKNQIKLGELMQLGDGKIQPPLQAEKLTKKQHLEAYRKEAGYTPHKGKSAGTTIDPDE